MVKHAIDKKSLREDAIRHTMFDVAEFVLKHKIWFISGVVGLFALVGAGVGYSYYATSQNLVIAEKFYEAEKILGNVAFPEKNRLAESSKAFKEFLKVHPNTPLSPVAWMFLAQNSWRQKDLDGAEKAFRSVIEHSKTAPLARQLANVGLAKLLETRGDFEGSAGYYNALPEEGYEDLKALGLGRVAWRQKNRKRQKNNFKKSRKAFPPLPWRDGRGTPCHWHPDPAKGAPPSPRNGLIQRAWNHP